MGIYTYVRCVHSFNFANQIGLQDYSQSVVALSCAIMVGRDRAHLELLIMLPEDSDCSQYVRIITLCCTPENTGKKD